MATHDDDGRSFCRAGEVFGLIRRRLDGGRLMMSTGDGGDQAVNLSWMVAGHVGSVFVNRVVSLVDLGAPDVWALADRLAHQLCDMARAKGACVEVSPDRAGSYPGGVSISSQTR